MTTESQSGSIIGQPGSCVAWVQDGLAWVKLDRAQKRNALDLRMWRSLEAVGAALLDRGDVRCAVVYGDGPSFCAGLDLTALSTLGGGSAGRPGSPVDDAGDVSPTESGGASRQSFDPIESLQRGFSWLIDAPFPTLAAVRGHALGAGWQLALSCDIVLAEAGTVFGMLETDYGLVPDMGGTARLVRHAGVHLAKYFVLTATKVTAEELAPLGLVAEVVPEGGVLRRAEELGAQLASRSPTALARAKRLVEDAFLSDQQSAYRSEARAQLECISSPDFAKALARYFERRSGRSESKAVAEPERRTQRSDSASD